MAEYDTDTNNPWHPGYIGRKMNHEEDGAKVRLMGARKWCPTHGAYDCMNKSHLYDNTEPGEVVQRRMPHPTVQQFATGATRSADTHKHDFEGYLSPAVLEGFGDYMTRHRVQRDGTLRNSDNWQKGIPISNYMKSLVRHTFDLWRAYRGTTVIDKDTGNAMTMVEIGYAIMFNVMGFVHETLKRGGANAYVVCDHTREAIVAGRPFSFYCPIEGKSNV